MRSPPTFITTTENNLTDYRITERFGVVRGITVRSRSVFGTLGAVLQQMRGGNISLLADLCEQTRAAAFDLAINHAKALGANALIALRYDATEIMQGVSEVLCYGTAVRVVPMKDNSDSEPSIP
ncbi:MAG: YbjQ family protein [Gemmatimonadaceae bacterium]